MGRLLLRWTFLVLALAGVFGCSLTSHPDGPRDSDTWVTKKLLTRPSPDSDRPTGFRVADKAGKAVQDAILWLYIERDTPPGKFTGRKFSFAMAELGRTGSDGWLIWPPQAIALGRGVNGENSPKCVLALSHKDWGINFFPDALSKLVGRELIVYDARVPMTLRLDKSNADLKNDIAVAPRNTKFGPLPKEAQKFWLDQSQRADALPILPIGFPFFGSLVARVGNCHMTLGDWKHGEEGGIDVQLPKLLPILFNYPSLKSASPQVVMREGFPFSDRMWWRFSGDLSPGPHFVPEYDSLDLEVSIASDGQVFAVTSEAIPRGGVELTLNKESPRLVEIRLNNFTAGWWSKSLFIEAEVLGQTSLVNWSVIHRRLVPEHGAVKMAISGNRDVDLRCVIEDYFNKMPDTWRIFSFLDGGDFDLGQSKARSTTPISLDWTQHFSSRFQRQDEKSQAFPDQPWALKIDDRKTPGIVLITHLGGQKILFMSNAAGVVVLPWGADSERIQLFAHGELTYGHFRAKASERFIDF